MFTISEIFYSIQGEGYWTGTPMLFIRMSGCNLECDFCDTDHHHGRTLSAEEILQELNKLSPRCCRVCITGGEPLVQPIESLVYALAQKDFLVHIETNGTIIIPELPPNVWVTCSPKTVVFEVDGCDEVKYLVGDDLEIWRHYLEEPPCIGIQEFLQPVWNNYYEDNLRKAIEIAKEHPRFRISLQTHKYTRIR